MTSNSVDLIRPAATLTRLRILLAQNVDIVARIDFHSLCRSNESRHEPSLRPASHAPPAHSSLYLRRSWAPFLRAAGAHSAQLCPAERTGATSARTGPDVPSPRRDETHFCPYCSCGFADRWVKKKKRSVFAPAVCCKFGSAVQDQGQRRR